MRSTELLVMYRALLLLAKSSTPVFVLIFFVRQQLISQIYLLIISNYVAKVIIYLRNKQNSP